ncbi:unnamed protein product [Macrosiphum euphorbiae]|uniref:Uncharacterized protein n=1 Tax=Macrosiphum euphorbiae TaxID=13131 RepID=A0AAV0VQB7_9HEMI|nr:unnamed protein product [Macrosiphum euphorbiae]
MGIGHITIAGHPAIMYGYLKLGPGIRIIIRVLTSGPAAHRYPVFGWCPVSVFSARNHQRSLWTMDAEPATLFAHLERMRNGVSTGRSTQRTRAKATVGRRVSGRGRGEKYKTILSRNENKESTLSSVPLSWPPPYCYNIPMSPPPPGDN